MFSAGVQEQLSGLQQQLNTLSQGQSKLGLEVAALKADAPHVPALSARVKTGSEAEQAADSSPVAAQSADNTSAAATLPNTSPAGGHEQSTLPVQPSAALGLQADDDLARRVDALTAEVRELASCYIPLPEMLSANVSLGQLQSQNLCICKCITSSNV